MIKYCEHTITFAEFPDEIALCVNISNCPGTCEACSEPYLRQNIGTELTDEQIDYLILSNPGITLFGFMGGDSDHKDIIRAAKHIKEFFPNIKIGMYSGRDSLDLDLIPYLDCYKIGRFILPKGPVEEWSKQNCGPLVFPFSNQLYFEKHEGNLVNATYKFRQHIISDLSKYIL